MNTWAQPGAECICISAPWRARGNFGPRLRERCVVAEALIADGILLLRIAGHDGWYLVSSTRRQRHAYAATCFRPVQKRTKADDMALFTHHLDKVGERA